MEPTQSAKGALTMPAHPGLTQRVQIEDGHGKRQRPWSHMMGTNSVKTKAVTVMVAFAVLASLWSGSSADERGRGGPDKKAASFKAIEGRLKNLEKLVGKSRTPVSERLDILEKGLRDLTMAMGGTGWSSVKSNIREAKKKLAEATRIHRQQDEDLRKLREVGKRLERIGADLGKLRHAVEEMERRLRRLGLLGGSGLDGAGQPGQNQWSNRLRKTSRLNASGCQSASHSSRDSTSSLAHASNLRMSDLLMPAASQHSS